MDMSPMGLWTSMGLIARLVVLILAALSVYSLTLSGERIWKYRAAKKQSLQFALLTTQYLKQDKPQEVIAKSKLFKNSHLARVVAAGLLEFMVEEQNSPLTGYDVIESARRAIERATLMTTADFKRGLGGLATIASTAPFIGLFGTVVGIINAFAGMAASGSGGIGAVSAGIAEALVTTALGLFVAIPAVWLYNFLLNQVERFQVEMANSASELVDFFIKKHGGSDAIGSAAR